MFTAWGDFFKIILRVIVYPEHSIGKGFSPVTVPWMKAVYVRAVLFLPPPSLFGDGSRRHRRRVGLRCGFHDKIRGLWDGLWFELWDGLRGELYDLLLSGRHDGFRSGLRV